MTPQRRRESRLAYRVRVRMAKVVIAVLAVLTLASFAHFLVTGDWIAFVAIIACVLLSYGTMRRMLDPRTVGL